jgi:hypothetical protein
MRVSIHRGSALILIGATNLENRTNKLGLSVRVMTADQLTEGIQLVTMAIYLANYRHRLKHVYLRVVLNNASVF